MKRLPQLALLTLMLLPCAAQAEPGLLALTVGKAANGGETWSLSLQVLLFMTALTLLPAALIMMTSFTRIVIVMSILRQALGTAQTPSNQILIGLSLFLTLFIMSPVFERVHSEALTPYMNEQIDGKQALEKAAAPFHGFMLAQTRETDLDLFARLSGTQTIESPDKTPFKLLLPAFVTSELKTAFQIGFLIFIPFLVIDLVVASVLMSMGMMMLSPVLISLPFKIMLFVLVDGWPLIMGTLAASFY
jgi:flagellar biosynthetic protein FliP